MTTQEVVVFPASSAQQRLWFFDQLMPDSPLYNITAALELRGPLNSVLLEQSVNEIVRRHETLRTSFASVDGQAVQVVAPATFVPLRVQELHSLADAEQAAQVQAAINQQMLQPFDLQRSPLLRTTLLQLATQHAVLVVSLHHIIADAWSMGVLLRELQLLYRAFSAGLPSPLPELPIQYIDVAHWQRSQTQALTQQLAYWKQQLADAPARLKLPADRTRAEMPSYRGATQSFTLPPAEVAALQALSQTNGTTLFMSLLAVFATLLYRTTGQDDQIVGTDVANRPTVETEALIGFFVNVLPLRLNLTRTMSFIELLRHVREVTLAAFTHQALPFDKLVEQVRPAREPGYAPLVQTLFVLQNTPVPELELPGLSLRPLEIHEQMARFDLAVFMQETPQGISGLWVYSTDLFATTTIARLMRQFVTVLSSVVTQPDAPLNTIELLTATEKEQQTMDRQNRKALNLKKFKSIAPKSEESPSEQLIKTRLLTPSSTLPLVIEPAVDDVDLVEWAAQNVAQIESLLLEHGGILFRGFDVPSVAEFERLAGAICPELFGEYGDLPREQEGDKVYASTPYPADQAILFHNESSHMHSWPLKQWFHCVKPSQEGGETPIVDCRQIYQRLDPAIRTAFAEKQIMYVRNFIPGLDVSWQEFFHTEDQALVETYCRDAGITVEWKAGGILKTSKVCPAVAIHPKTGEHLFFNQIQLHHVSCLDADVRDSLRATFGEENLPRNAYFGDGSLIDDAIVEEILKLYWETSVRFPWQAGDILMVDNMLTAHARMPFVGPRKIVVSMGEMIDSTSV